jgi:hypothetical protein
MLTPASASDVAFCSNLSPRESPQTYHRGLNWMPIFHSLVTETLRIWQAEKFRALHNWFDRFPSVY